MQVIDSKLNKTTSVGISLPMNGSSVFNRTYSQREQIKSNLINMLLTNKGERLFIPEFGTNVRKMLFNPIIETETFENELRSEIHKHFSSQIELINLAIAIDNDMLLVRIVIEYIVKGESESDYFDLNFQ